MRRKRKGGGPLRFHCFVALLLEDEGWGTLGPKGESGESGVGSLGPKGESGESVVGTLGPVGGG